MAQNRDTPRSTIPHRVGRIELFGITLFPLVGYGVAMSRLWLSTIRSSAHFRKYRKNPSIRFLLSVTRRNRLEQILSIDKTG